MGRPDVDLVVIGFGSAGMTATEFAAGLGLRVCVIERDRAGEIAYGPDACHRKHSSRPPTPLT